MADSQSGSRCRRLFEFFIIALFFRFSYGQDRVYWSLCRGVNIYKPWMLGTEDLFGVCVNMNQVTDSITQGIKSYRSSSFKITRLNRSLKEFVNKKNELAIGVRDFAKQVWGQGPFTAIMTPFASVSGKYNTVMFNAEAVKNIYLKSRHPRIEAYQKRVRDEAVYVAGRTYRSEHFSVEWTTDPTQHHLTAYFRQRARNLDASDHSLDSFIKDFGTHYRRSVTFGGEVGADFYFDSYGTPRDLINAMQHVNNADILAAQNVSYKPPFQGFTRNPVTHFAWSRGGRRGDMEVNMKYWFNNIKDDPEIIGMELRSVTELLEAAQSPNVYVLMDKLEDRIARNAIRLATEAYTCFHDRSCRRDQLCMGNQCVRRPMAPKWPDNGRFCLPKPFSQRCPSPDEYDSFTDDTWVHWDTENGFPDEPYSSADHITAHGLTKEQVLAMIEGDEGLGIKMFYCCRKEPTAPSWQRKSWPAGTYCLYAQPTFSVLTPRHWSFDSILWNDEDTDNRNNWKTQPNSGSLPFGHYRPSYTEQKLICRKDGDPMDAIVLPKEFPFYLIRNGETCQEVWGMEWTHVQVTWDTENGPKNGGPIDTDVDPNGWVRWNIWRRVSRNCVTNCVPKCEADKDQKTCVKLTPDKIVMDFCYYEEIKTPSPTPMPTPAPTPPTRAPTTGAPTPEPPTPTPPPTPPPPTKRPTPGPTRPTPSPVFPTPPPTRSPTLAPPTPRPTKKPTPAPTPPTPAPTKRPTPSPTPAPTDCPFCPWLQGVNIVGLNSKWPNDRQPEKLIFSVIPCDCNYCDRSKGECKTRENCRIKYHMGDIMLLRKFWLDRPIELEADDLLFLRLTWHPDQAPLNGPKNNHFRGLTMDQLRKGMWMDLSHARNALVYGGSYRMQDYGKAYSIMQRHIHSDYKDTVLMATHWVARAMVRHIAEATRQRPPIQNDLTFDFQTEAAELHKLVNGELRGNTAKKTVDREFDKFIDDYGTHYIDVVAVGGEYGADWLWSGYGTKAEMTLAMRDIKNADISGVFERNRFRNFDEPLNGGGFVRKEEGPFFFPNDIKSWINGGDPYGIRGGYGHEEWEKYLDQGEGIAILHYKRLISIGKIFGVFEQPSYVSNWGQHVSLMLERYKTRVYYKAHYWLVLHYWCFIMDNACENQRRRPFLREAILGRCDSSLVSRKFLRSRTEMETCIGQRDRQDGYMVRSKYFPFKWTNWCRGDYIKGHPTNYPPFTLVRKGNCPLVPPTPRWANAHSWCLPKPIVKKDKSKMAEHERTFLECPKEEFPEYEWNWDWQKFIQDHHWEKGQFSAVTENQIFSIYYININPTSEIWSSYPWKYDVHDFTPRSTPYSKVVDVDAITRQQNEMYDSVETLLNFLQGYKGNMLPVRNTSCYDLCNYAPGYHMYPLYPVNRVYIRTQAPFLQEIGWAFWDTEDDTDDRPVSEMQVAIDPTPTHMEVAEHWTLQGNWDVPCTGDKNSEGVPCEVCCKFTAQDYARGGKSSKHAVLGAHDKKYRLWDPPPMASFKTGGTRMQFCCTTISEKQEDKHWHDLHWPDGHLCIYAHGAVDSVIYEFRQGSIGWDCENGRIQDEKRYGNKIYSDSANDMFANWDDVATQQRLTHSLPTGLYHIQYDGLSNQFFSQNLLCMDAIPDPDHRIELPRDRPFYLMQKKGTCQRVVGMFHTRVSLTWHTESRHMTKWVETPTYSNAFVPLEMNSWGRAQAFGRRDTIPDGHYGQDKIQIWYCFYQPNVIYYRRKAGETAPGLEPYYFLDMEQNPLDIEDKGRPERVLLRENDKDEVFFYDIVIMDKNGVYNVYWDNNPTTLCPRV